MKSHTLWLVVVSFCFDFSKPVAAKAVALRRKAQPQSCPTFDFPLWSEPLCYIFARIRIPLHGYFHERRPSGDLVCLSASGAIRKIAGCHIFSRDKYLTSYFSNRTLEEKYELTNLPLYLFFSDY